MLFIFVWVFALDFIVSSERLLAFLKGHIDNNQTIAELIFLLSWLIAFCLTFITAIFLRRILRGNASQH